MKPNSDFSPLCPGFLSLRCLSHIFPPFLGKKAGNWPHPPAVSWQRCRDLNLAFLTLLPTGALLEECHITEQEILPETMGNQGIFKIIFVKAENPLPTTKQGDALGHRVGVSCEGFDPDLI